MKTGPDMANLPFFQILFLAGAALLIASMFAYWVLFKTENEASQTYRKGQILFGLIVLILHGIMTRGVRQLAGFAAVCLSMGTIVEILGVKKGWVFGRYRYSESMGPRLFGSLPAAVPLMWFAICYLGGSMMELLVRGMNLPAAALPPVRVVVASGIVTLFDAVIDPIAVAENRWIWEKPGRYHGVPASNFIGWSMTAMVIFTLLNSFFYRFPVRQGVPGWLVFLPAFGHCLFLALCAKVCVESNLRLAGVIGWTGAAAFFAAGILALRGLAR
jgi:uncharacterized membrane protein